MRIRRSSYRKPKPIRYRNCTYRSITRSAPRRKRNSSDSPFYPEIRPALSRAESAMRDAAKTQNQNHVSLNCNVPAAHTMRRGDVIIFILFLCQISSSVRRSDQQRAFRPFDDLEEFYLLSGRRVDIHVIGRPFVFSRKFIRQHLGRISDGDQR